MISIRQTAWVVLSAAAVGLTGCGRSATEARLSTAPVHGTPIVKATVAAPGTVPANAAKPAEKPINPAPVSGTAIGPSDSAPMANLNASQTLGFDKLASYNFETPDGPITNQPAATADSANDQIPLSIKALTDKRFAIKGFMLPLKVDGGSVTEFLLMKDQSMCCYGNVPKITEWINVKTAGKGMKPILDQPISIEGTLHVGAVRENGYLVGIYQMDGEKMLGTTDK